ncbi:hypothetical protein WICPIJ_009079 [Wickerhamomyces pijperi]|uniref:Manganese resistance protein MNR2 n=1 Tax=Wickerhamomyces pijperi TaxID=599730 RepID=A0A9P8PSH8_WICPI|nr:hypothetical protein WICPIJ_009079 [Wickerhamomyces pijperi]
MSYLSPTRSLSPKDRTPLLQEEHGSPPMDIPNRFEVRSPDHHLVESHSYRQAPPKAKRRPTFSGPNQDRNSIDSTLYSTPHFAEEFEITNALGHVASRANSMSTMNSQNVLRDFRNYDPRNIPSAKHLNSDRRRQQSVSSNLSTSVPYQPVSTKHRVGAPLSSGGLQNPTQVSKADWLRHHQLDRGYGSLTSSSPIANLLESADNSGNKTGISIDQSDDDLDFRSNPSSRRSSRSSSLGDVCFPLDQLDTNGERKWPDFAVLEEFFQDEMGRLKDEALKETDEANFRFTYNNDQSEEQSSDVASSTGVGFSYPIITKVDAPRLLSNQQVNETEAYTGRLRPPKINPFDRKKTNNADFLRTINYPPHIINNNPEHFRFTYFREDLDATVHSPTISGLLQPGQKFEDIFSYQEYIRRSKATNNSHQGSHPASLRETTPEIGMTASALRSESPSVGAEADGHIPPFWLDILNPTEEEMKVLSKAFGIHPLTTEDIFLGETREKVELFKDYYFVCFRSFDIVHEKIKRRNIEAASAAKESQNMNSKAPEGIFSKFFGARNRRQSSARSTQSLESETSSMKRKAREIELEKFKRKSGDRHKPKGGELEPLNVYILVFRHAVLTFHFAPTPHPVNVRRRARLLNEYLTVSADWIAYALIDDITDAFGPMIESIEDEVNDIEDTILSMTQGSDSDETDSDSDGDDDIFSLANRPSLKHRESVVGDKRSIRSVSTTSTRSTSSNIIEWKRKGHMLKRIGETRKRVMSLLRLLGSKADVIKGFAKRCNEQWEIAPRSEIGMYLGDIQDHIVTMVQSLNHYEKLLARSHSNYLAQINIDMTRVNNDMNDVLGKITILGTVVLPMNIITGLWGMNVIVPGQEYDGLMWFYGLVCFMLLIAVSGYIFAKRMSGI